MPVLIAFSGIDGAGKTTLVQELTRLPFLAAAHVFKKTYRDNTDRLGRFYGAHLTDPRNYLEGPFALEQRWAYALDFLWFYQHEIATKLQDGSVALLDRWTPCIDAWTAMVEHPAAASIHALSSRLPPPHVVFHLQVDPALAWNRICERGFPKPDEDLSILRAFHSSYRKVLPRLTMPTYIIDTSSLAAAVTKTAAIINELIRSALPR